MGSNEGAQHLDNCRGHAAAWNWSTGATGVSARIMRTILGRRAHSPHCSRLALLPPLGGTRPWGRRSMGVALLAVVAGLVLASGRQPRPDVRSVAVGHDPTVIVVDAQTARAFVANQSSASVSMLDARTGRLLATIAVGPFPYALAVATRAGRVFVATAGFVRTGGFNGGTYLTMLDAASGHLLRTIPIGPGADAIVVDERLNRVFVTQTATDSVRILDARTGASLGQIPVGPNPMAAAVDRATDHVFIANYRADLHDRTDRHAMSSVTMLDARTGASLGTIQVGALADAIATDSRRRHVFVANSASNTISMIDTRTGLVLRSTRVGAVPGAMGVDERTGRLFSANSGDGSVSMLDTHNGRVLRTVAVALPPTAVVVDQHVNEVFVLTGGTLSSLGVATKEGVMVVLDGRTGELLRRVSVGWDPRALAVDEATGTVFVTNAGGIPAPRSFLDTLVTWAGPVLSALPLRLPLRAAPPTTGSVTMLSAARSEAGH